MRADGEQPAELFPLRTQVRSVPLAVWALVGVQLMVLLSYSVLMPVYRAPDEPQNIDIAMAARTFTGFTGHHDAITPMVVRSYPFAAFTQETRRRPVSPDPPVARGSRPTYAALASPPATSMTRNQQWQHPPLYPATLGAVVTVVETLYPPAYTWAFDQTAGFARVVSTLLVAPLPLFAFLVARRLTSSRVTALAAAVFPLAIPQLAHIGSAVSHDNLLVLLVGAATVAVAFVLRGDASLRTAVVLGTLGGLGLLTKGFALVLPAWIGGVYALAAVRWRRWRFVGVGALAVTLMVVIGGWWWVRNVSVHGTLQPTGVRLAQPEPGFVPDAGWWVRWFAEVMPERFWGNLGWYQASLSDGIVVTATVVLGLAVVAALARRPPGSALSDLLAAAAPLAGIAAIVAYGGWNYYANTGYALGLQGRYLFPGLAGLAVLVGSGVAALPRGLARWGPVGLLVAAAAMEAVAVGTVLREVYQAGGAIGWGDAVRAVVAWSPWSPAVLAAGLVALAVLLAVAAAALVGEARRAPADVAPDRPAGDEPRPPAGEGRTGGRPERAGARP